MFGVQKFHKYLYGRPFHPYTDRKPLVNILSPKTAVPTLTAATIHHWVVILQAYNQEVEYRPSKEDGNVDALSRLPRNDPLLKEEAEKDIRRDTRKDPVLARVFNYTLTGWSNYVTSYERRPYFIRRHELSVDQGFVLWCCCNENNCPKLHLVAKLEC